MPPLTSNDERVILYLMGSDPDVVVELLGITTRELLNRFPAKVRDYIANEVNNDGEDEDSSFPFY